MPGRAVEAAGDVDLITDLAAEDLINLSLIDADATRAGDQRFKLVSGPGLRASEAKLVYDAGLDRTELRLEIDGAPGVDMIVLISGDQPNFANFVL